MRKVRRWIAWPFKLMAWLFIIAAFMISWRDGNDTLSKWMEAEFIP